MRVDISDDDRTPTESPAKVWIERTARGALSYGVEVSAPTLRAARLRAIREYEALRTWAARVEQPAPSDETTRAQQPAPIDERARPPRVRRASAEES